MGLNDRVASYSTRFWWITRTLYALWVLDTRANNGRHAEALHLIVAPYGARLVIPPVVERDYPETGAVKSLFNTPGGSVHCEMTYFRDRYPWILDETLAYKLRGCGPVD